MLRLADDPQLRFIAWHRRDAVEIDEREAFALYEARWRHLDEPSLTANERELIRRLAQRYGNGLLNV